MSAFRLWYWSLRRELWENRSIYLAPLAVAGLTLFGFLIATLGRALSSSDPATRRAVLEEPLGFVSLVIMAATFIVAVFYCADALYGERRDRSILFWKSLPVSDLITVLSKAAVPILVLPVLSFIITIAIQFIMLSLGSLVLLTSGMSASGLWTTAVIQAVMLLFHLVAIHGLWYAPIYAWLLFVSAWARRAPFLWALLPLVAVAFVEKIAFNTMHFTTLLAHRMGGGPHGDLFMEEGDAMHVLAQHSPGRFLLSPGLWIGLALAAALLAGAVRLRRKREPI